jgi:hypothetical protein
MQAGFYPEIEVFLCLCQELFVIFLKSKKNDSIIACVIENRKVY